MGNFLAAVGRAQPVTAIQDFQTKQGNILGQEKRRAVADLTMQNLQQNIDIKKREADVAIKAEEDALRPIAVEPLLNGFEGGPESPMAKMVYEDAVGAGLVDLSQGGLGTINKKSATEIRKRISDPMFAAKLSRTRVDYWRGLYGQASQAAAAKPGDEKAQAELQRVTDGLNQSLGQDKAMTDGIAARQEQAEETPTAWDLFLKSNPNPTRDQVLEFQKTEAIAKEGTQDAEDPQERFKVVGNKLYDLSNPDQPKEIGTDPKSLSDYNLFETKDGTVLDMTDPKNPVPVYSPTEDGGPGYAPDKLTKLFDKMDSLEEGNPRREDYQSVIDQMVSGGSPGVERVLAERIIDGKLDFNKLSRRGKQKGRIAAIIAEIDPDFNLIDAEANIKYKTDSANLRSIALIAGIEPLYEKLSTKAVELGNTTLPIFNKGVNFYKLQTGDEKIVAFNNLRDDVIAETERVLLGTGVLSDSKYLRALGNLNSAQSPKQMGAAIRQMMLVVDKRGEALKTKPYPQSQGGDDGQQDLPMISTQEEYNKLPSGATYIEDNGREYVKP